MSFYVKPLQQQFSIFISVLTQQRGGQLQTNTAQAHLQGHYYNISREEQDQDKNKEPKHYN